MMKAMLLGLLAASLSATEVPLAAAQPGTDRPPVFTPRPGKFVHPMALAFLPNGDIVVGQGDGRLVLRKPDGSVTAIAGMPASSMLRDIVVMPGPHGASVIYFTYAEPKKLGAWLALGRADVSGDSTRLAHVQTLWRGASKRYTGSLAGALAVAPDQRTLYLSAAIERWGVAGPHADVRPPKVPGKKRSLITIATLYRMTLLPNGQVRAAPISVGHRNPLGMGLAADGRLWESDMGPKGGDEINLIVPGRNYGWPYVSNGDNYDGTVIPDHKPGDGYEPPKIFWNPSVSPAGFMIYTGAMFPQWRGSAFMGGLSSEALLRITINGAEVAKADQWPMQARIRDVAQAPDGSIWMIEDQRDASLGRLIQVTPAR